MAQAGYTPIQLYFSTTAAAVPLAANLAQGELAINIADGKLYYENSSGVVTLLASSTTVTNSFSAGTTGFTPSTATTGAVTLGGTLITSNGGTGLASYTAGDLSYYASGTALTKLAIGTAGQILTSSGTAPQWSTLSGVAVTTFSAGTTGFTPSSATSGAVTLAGTLATTNGGTGLTSFTSGGVVYASSSSALATGSALTFDGTTLGVNNGVAGGTAVSLTGTYSGSGSVNFLTFQRVGGAVAGALRYSDDNPFGMMFGTTTSHAQIFMTANTERMRITSAGNVGIGLTPTEKFQVYNGSGDTLSYGSNPRLILTVPTGTNGMRIVADTTPFEAVHPTNGSQFGIGADANVTINAVNATAGATTKSSPTIAFLSKYWTGSASSSQMQGFIGVTSTAATNTGGYFGFGVGDASALRIDPAGNLGLGVTPSAWYVAANSYRGLQVGFGGVVYGRATSNQTGFASNFFAGTSGADTYINNGHATTYQQISGEHQWYNAPSNSSGAGAPLTFTQAMTLDASGQLIVGNTSASSRLHVTGSANTYAGSGLLLGTAGVASGYIWTTDNLYIKPLQSGGTASGSINFQTSSNTNSVVFETATANALKLDSSGNLGLGVTPKTWNSATKAYELPYGALWSLSSITTLSNNNYYSGAGQYIYSNNGYASEYYQYEGTHVWRTAASGTAGASFSFTSAMTLNASGGLQTLNTIGVGNATPSTSGAGITFPATQSASSGANTLDDYEEGTWFPNQGSGLTVVGTFESVGYYTKIGNIVTITGYVRGLTNISCTSNGIICTNAPLPGGVGGIFWSGTSMNWNADSGGVCGVQQATTNIYSASVITASDRISFTITYQAG